MSKKIGSIVLVLMSIFLFSQQTAMKKVKFSADKKLSSVTYSMVHPLHKWSATSNDITSLIVASENKATIDKLVVSIKVSTFDSKNANRDSHMIEAVEGIKYPSVTFFSNGIKTEGDKITINGVVNFHGKDKPVVFVGTKKLSGGKLEIAGTFNVKVTDFNLKCPSIMGFATEDNIKLDVKLVY